MKTIHNDNNMIGEVSYTKYGTPMKIIAYNSYSDIIVEFQDEHKARVNTQYCNFSNCLDEP